MNNIGKIIKEKGISQKAIAIALGVSQPTVSDWVSGKKSPSSKRATELADYFNVSIDSLLGRDSTVESNASQLSSDESNLLNLYRSSDLKIRAIALSILEIGQHISKENGPDSKNIDMHTVETHSLGYYEDYPVSAGTGNWIDETQKETLTLTTAPPEGASYVCRVSGNSMQPLYNDGDKIFIAAGPAIALGEIGIFIYENEVYIKRAGEGQLLSENPAYKPIDINNPDSLFCIGTVLGKVDENDIIES